MVSEHRTQACTPAVKQKHKAGATATNAVQSHTHTHTHTFTSETRKTPLTGCPEMEGERDFLSLALTAPLPFLPLSLTLSQVPGTSGGGDRKAWAGLPRPRFLPRGGRTGSWGSSRNPGSPHDFPPRPGCPRRRGRGAAGPPSPRAGCGWLAAGPARSGPGRPPRGGPVPGAARKVLSSRLSRPPAPGQVGGVWPEGGAGLGGRGSARPRARPGLVPGPGASWACEGRGPGGVSGCGGLSVWAPGCDSASGYDGAAAVRRAVGDSPGCACGAAAVRPSGHGRPPGGLRGPDVSGLRVWDAPGGAVTCQAACVPAVPVGNGDPSEDVCVTAGGSQPDALIS